VLWTDWGFGLVEGSYSRVDFQVVVQAGQDVLAGDSSGSYPGPQEALGYDACLKGVVMDQAATSVVGSVKDFAADQVVGKEDCWGSLPWLAIGMDHLDAEHQVVVGWAFLDVCCRGLEN
jgi:hypothetical protein